MLLLGETAATPSHCFPPSGICYFRIVSNTFYVPLSVIVLKYDLLTFLLSFIIYLLSLNKHKLYVHNGAGSDIDVNSFV